MKNSDTASWLVAIFLLSFLLIVGFTTVINEVRVESYENGWREGQMNLEQAIWQHQVGLCVDGDMAGTTHLECAEKATEITKGWRK